MDETAILERLSETAAEHFNEPDLQLTSDTVAADVPGWDSLAHIQFLMEVENAFKIRFKSSEVGSFANVGQLVARIKTKLNG
jgi:acyl carrier protein